MDDRRMDSTHERQEQRNSCRKLQTKLPLMWKLLTSIFHLSCQELLPHEQKGCRNNSRGTKDQLLIDKAILKNCRRRITNLSMAWIDYQKAYDMVPQFMDFGICKNGWSGPEYT